MEIFSPRRSLMAALLAATCLAPAVSRSQDATWDLNPNNSNFNTKRNWSTNKVPSGTAFFDVSNITTITVNGFSSQNINGLTFNPNAPAYTFNSADFTFNGAGIVNNAFAPILNNTGTGRLTFNNSASAGNAIINNSG